MQTHWSKEMFRNDGIVFSFYASFVVWILYINDFVEFFRHL
jgi:hypothetical protein